MITAGLGRSSHDLILSGFGSTIIIPISPPPPTRPPTGGIIVPQYYEYIISRKFAFTLEELNILKQYGTIIDLKPISAVKLLKINYLLKELDIVLSDEVQYIFNVLVLMSRDSSDEQIETLNLTEQNITKPLIEDLNILYKKQDIYGIDIPNLTKNIKNSIDLQIPDIYKLNTEQLKRYLELIKLLDILDI